VAEIQLGSGKVFIGMLKRKEDGVIGLLFSSTNEEHRIGEKHSDWKLGVEYQIKESDVVVWISSLDSARVLSDAVTIIALSLNGYEVKDKQEGI